MAQELQLTMVRELDPMTAPELRLKMAPGPDLKMVRELGLTAPERNLKMAPGLPRATSWGPRKSQQEEHWSARPQTRWQTAPESPRGREPKSAVPSARHQGQGHSPKFHSCW